MHQLGRTADHMPRLKGEERDSEGIEDRMSSACSVEPSSNQTRIVQRDGKPPAGSGNVEGHVGGFLVGRPGGKTTFWAARNDAKMLRYLMQLRPVPPRQTPDTWKEWTRIQLPDADMAFIQQALWRKLPVGTRLEGWQPRGWHGCSVTRAARGEGECSPSLGATSL